MGVQGSMLQGLCEEAQRVRLRAGQLLDQQSRVQAPALKRRLRWELDQLLQRRQELARIAERSTATADPLAWSLLREIIRRPLVLA
ncbi:hypothetical protein [Vulcanococcus sp.]|jgi:hypothetical protein|uniref:hypothetical protein n=1 Tax=Vulcanococcus sp. TaxID=2856995 RepID=UPI00323EDEBB